MLQRASFGAPFLFVYFVVGTYNKRMAQKFTTDFVQSVFRERGVTPLFDRYQSAHVKLPFRCSCPEEREGSVSWANLYMRKMPDGSAPIPRCPHCVREFKQEVARRPEVRKGLEGRNVHTTDSVRAVFSAGGVEALLDHYEGLNAPISFRCICQGVGKTTLDSVLEMNRQSPGHQIQCRGCITRKVLSQKPDEMTPKAKAHLKSFGATPLFDKFPGLYAPMRFRCECGQEAEMMWVSFNNGTPARCSTCHHANRPRGETHPNWNPALTAEDRAKRDSIRTGWAMQKWYADVKEAAHFTCALSGQVGGELASHHIAWVSRNEDKMLDLDNGVCIAAWLHVLFHRLYPRSREKTPDEVAMWDQFCTRYRAGEFTGEETPA